MEFIKLIRAEYQKKNTTQKGTMTIQFEQKVQRTPRVLKQNTIYHQSHKRQIELDKHETWRKNQLAVHESHLDARLYERRVSLDFNRHRSSLTTAIYCIQWYVNYDRLRLLYATL